MGRVGAIQLRNNGLPGLWAARQETFDPLRFASCDGAAFTGAQVKVVKQVHGRFDGMQQPGLRWMAQASDDAFWYCVGPGPSRYLVIPISRRNGFQWDVDWVVRPLDEGRMRAALSGDTEALWLAFGRQTGQGRVEIEYDACADLCVEGSLKRSSLKPTIIREHVRSWPENAGCYTSGLVVGPYWSVYRFLCVRSFEPSRFEKGRLLIILPPPRPPPPPDQGVIRSKVEAKTYSFVGACHKMECVRISKCMHFNRGGR